MKVVSHVIGLFQFYYLFSCAGGWLNQHCFVIATVIIYKAPLACLAQPCEQRDSVKSSKNLWAIEKSTRDFRIKSKDNLVCWIVEGIWLHVYKGEFAQLRFRLWARDSIREIASWSLILYSIVSFLFLYFHTTLTFTVFIKLSLQI